jgi:hypothetical protein
MKYVNESYKINGQMTVTVSITSLGKMTLRQMAIHYFQASLEPTRVEDPLSLTCKY